MTYFLQESLKRLIFGRGREVFIVEEPSASNISSEVQGEDMKIIKLPKGQKLCNANINHNDRIGYYNAVVCQNLEDYLQRHPEFSAKVSKLRRCQLRQGMYGYKVYCDRPWSFLDVEILGENRVRIP